MTDTPTSEPCADTLAGTKNFELVVDPEQLSEVPTDRLEERITSHAALIAAETAVFLRLLAEFDRRGGWQVDRVKSLAHWLNWKLGMNMRTAQEHVRMARALTVLPKITEAFSNGEISYSRVRAITRVAEPETEDQLLDVARHSTGAQLEERLRNHDEGKPAAAPELTRRTDADERAVITFKGSPADAELIWKAVSRAVSECKEKTIDERRADALVALADAYLASAPTDRSGSDRTQVVVHEEADGTHRLDDGTVLHQGDAERLTCDASSLTVTHHDGCCDSGDELGRNTAGVSESMRRRVLMRDNRRCQWTGCNARHWLYIHHVIHREHGGKTILSNLVALCGHHHRVLHADGYRMQRSDDTWDVIRPDGTTIDPTPPRQCVPRNAHERSTHQPDALTSQWDGSPLDLGLWEPLRPPVQNVPRNAPSEHWDGPEMRPDSDR